MSLNLAHCGFQLSLLIQFRPSLMDDIHRFSTVDQFILLRIPLNLLELTWRVIKCDDIEETYLSACCSSIIHMTYYSLYIQADALATVNR